MYLCTCTKCTNVRVQSTLESTIKKKKNSSVMLMYFVTTHICKLHLTKWRI